MTGSAAAAAAAAAVAAVRVVFEGDTGCERGAVGDTVPAAAAAALAFADDDAVAAVESTAMAATSFTTFLSGDGAT